jgi:hypothetical protein
LFSPKQLDLVAYQLALLYLGFRFSQLSYLPASMRFRVFQMKYNRYSKPTSVFSTPNISNAGTCVVEVTIIDFIGIWIVVNCLMLSE